jgi:hypothetical protein
MKKEKKKLTIYAGLLFITLVVLLPIAASFLIGELLPYIYAIGLGSTSSDNPQFACTPVVDMTEEYALYVDEKWVESDEIRGYEDIPETERANLSEEVKRFLRDSGQVDYTPSYYQNLSQSDKELFMRATRSRILINSSEMLSVINSFEDNTSYNDIRYNNTTYECREIIRDEEM